MNATSISIGVGVIVIAIVATSGWYFYYARDVNLRVAL